MAHPRDRTLHKYTPGINVTCLHSVTGYFLVLRARCFTDGTILCRMVLDSVSLCHMILCSMVLYYTLLCGSCFSTASCVRVGLGQHGPLHRQHHAVQRDALGCSLMLRRKVLYGKMLFSMVLLSMLSSVPGTVLHGTLQLDSLRRCGLVLLLAVARAAG